VKSINEIDLPKSLPYFFFEKIRTRIIQGVYPPGYPLREQEIENEFSTSRGTMRESLRLLVNSGLVEHKQRRGFRVKEYSEKVLRDLYHLRSFLEGMVVISLANADLDHLIDELQSLLRRMDEFCEENKCDDYFLENMKFHQKMIDFAGNEPLALVLHYLNEMSLPVRYLKLAKNFPDEQSVNYHKKIVSSIALGNFEEGAELAKSHIMEDLDGVIKVYKEEQGKTLNRDSHRHYGSPKRHSDATRLDATGFNR